MRVGAVRWREVDDAEWPLDRELRDSRLTGEGLAGETRTGSRTPCRPEPRHGSNTEWGGTTP